MNPYQDFEQWFAFLDHLKETGRVELKPAQQHRHGGIAIPVYKDGYDPHEVKEGDEHPDRPLHMQELL